MLLLVFVLSDPFWYDGLLKDGCRVLLHFAATLSLSLTLSPAHTLPIGDAYPELSLSL